jgi:hypothetical protein
VNDSARDLNVYFFEISVNSILECSVNFEYYVYLFELKRGADNNNHMILSHELETQL